MSIKRRDFLRLSASSAVVGTAVVTGMSSCNTSSEKAKENTPLDDLKKMTGDVVPISLDERKSRIAKAQKLMGENKIEAIILDAGTSLDYFTGIRWGGSERPMVAVIPAHGEVKYVSPGFEAARLRQLIKIGTEVAVWEEHESPYKQVVNVLKSYGINSGSIGIEERLRFFIYDGIRKEAPGLTYVSADPVTMNCRLIKTAAELALMQKANDISSVAAQVAISMLKEGMTPSEFSAITSAAHSRLGANGSFAVNFGEDSAYPHGSIKPQKLKKGDIVLLDGGCKVEGYNSDISRTVVFGEPSKRQREIWDLEKKAQAAGFAAAQLGQPCENVDIAARKVLVDAGFGPGYKIPGLPHRTGHGIGMDGHEWGNMVLGNKLLLQEGMCFSIEPNISIYGEFGVRLEDCAHMTAQGVKWFSEPSPSIEKPFV